MGLTPQIVQRIKSSKWIAPVALILVTVAIRLFGIKWGLADSLHNQSLHPDEEIIWRYSQLIDPAHLKFTPGFYNYGTFYLTLLRVASDFVAAYFGGPSSGNDWAYIARCEFAGRIISTASCGVLAWAVYAGTKRLAGKWAGVVAGLCIAFAPGLVVHSRFSTVDVLATALIGLSVHQAIRLMTLDGDASRLRMQASILCGVFAGLSAGTKYSGALIVIVGLVAIAFSRPKTWLKEAATVCGATIGAFILSTPGVLLDSKEFWSQFNYERVHIATGHGLVFVGTSSGYLFQIANLGVGLGLLLLLLGIVGLTFGVIHKKAWGVALAAFFVVYWVVIGSAEVKFERYCFPLIVPLAIAIGIFVMKLNAKGGIWRLGVAAAIVGLGGLDGGGALGSARFTLAMMTQDPRESSAVAIKALSNDQTHVGIVDDPWFWTPTLYPNTGLIRPDGFRLINQFRLDARDPSVDQYVPGDFEQRQDWDSRLLTEMKPQYVVFSDFESLDIARVSQMKDIPQEYQDEVNRFTAFQKVLQRDYKLTAVYGYQTDLVHDMRYVTPTVYLWKRT